ncbi:MAG: hypothetical protein NC218_08790 [Acetobacter sp.]|nr:hypothetical protein [Acetobacter sp.]
MVCAWSGRSLDSGSGAGCPRGMTQKRGRDDGEEQVFLICHRSERSEVKRSGESMGVFMDCHALVPYGGARNDGERWDEEIP